MVKLEDIPEKPLSDLYQDSIKRTELACAYYLEQHGFAVASQKTDSNLPKLLNYEGKKLVYPDLDVFLPKTMYTVFVEIKSYNEALAPKFYKLFPKEREAINKYIGFERFEFGQLYNYEQGLDDKDYQNYYTFQKKFIQSPIIIAFNDFKLKTWDRNKGLWYGAYLSEFKINKDFRTNPKNQWYLPLSKMEPIDILINRRKGKRFLLNYLSVLDYQNLINGL